MTIRDEMERALGQRRGGIGPRKGIHGGHIGGDDPTPTARGDTQRAAQANAHERARPPTQRRASQHAAEVNALEAALARSPHGRRMLELLAEAAALRIHEALAHELVTGSEQVVARLRRALVTTRDPLERDRIAGQLPAAEDELRKWRAAHVDYQSRREYAEYALRDGMRAFA